MKKNIFGNVLLAFIVVAIGITVLSCKRSFDNDFNGEAICPSDNFAVSSPLVLKSTAGGSTTSVDMSTAATNITATFNEVVSWTVEVRGATSGAFKSFTGRSNQINIIWSGEPDTAPFFKAESVTASLKLNCKTEVYGTASINFTALPSFSTLPGYVSNMEPPTQNALDGLPSNGKIACAFKNVGSLGYEGSPEGGYYLNMQGNTAVPAWYFGQYNNNLAPGYFSGLNADPNTVYFNVYLKGLPGSQAQIIFNENIPGLIEPKARKVNFDLTTSWKMYTVKLADIGIINPQNITKVNTNLGASPVQVTEAQLDMDLIIFTNNAPLLK